MLKYFLSLEKVSDDCFRAVIWEIDNEYFNEYNNTVEDILECNNLDELRKMIKNRDKNLCLDWVNSMRGGNDITFRKMWNLAVKEMTV